MSVLVVACVGVVTKIKLDVRCCTLMLLQNTDMTKYYY